MFCQYCRKLKHVCARPGCGHSKFENHTKGYCNHGRHGASSECSCGGYLESTDEKLCRETKEAEQKWPADAIALLVRLGRGLHVSHPEYDKVIEMVKRGEKIINRIVVSS